MTNRIAMRLRCVKYYVLAACIKFMLVFFARKVAVRAFSRYFGQLHPYVLDNFEKDQYFAVEEHRDSYVLNI